MQMLWERHGILPRNLILVEVTHRKVPYVRDDRYQVTVFDRDHQRGSIIAVEVSFGFMEEPNVERLLEEMALHKEIDLPTDRRQWRIFCRRGVWGSSGGSDFGCSFCCASCRSRLIIITGWEMKCSSQSRSFPCECGRRLGELMAVPPATVLFFLEPNEYPVVLTRFLLAIRSLRIAYAF